MKTSNKWENIRAEKIDEITMKNAILKSGYFMERRVASLLRDKGYKVITNRGFVDQETDKSREYDVYAYKDIIVYEPGSFSIYPTLICECKNNPLPIVFFAQEPGQFKPLIDEVAISGIPTKIWLDKKYISIQEFTDVKKFHHYCLPRVPVSTQCCTFEMKKDKSSWMASHGEELYEIFRTITKALEQEIDNDFRNMNQWFAPEEKEKQFIDLSFYYPLVIFQGEIYVANQNDNDITLEKREHIQYNPEFFSFYENEVISYHIDIITEKYLPTYLDLVNDEMNVIRYKLLQQKEDVIATIDRLLIECNLEKKQKTYRTQLEFRF